MYTYSNYNGKHHRMDYHQWHNGHIYISCMHRLYHSVIGTGNYSNYHIDQYTNMSYICSYHNLSEYNHGHPAPRTPSSRGMSSWPANRNGLMCNLGIMLMMGLNMCCMLYRMLCSYGMIGSNTGHMSIVDTRRMSCGN